MADRNIDSDQASESAMTSRLLRYVPLLAIGNIAVAVPTFLISLTLAYFTFIQAEATQKMQVATVWPYVSYATSNYDSDGRARISLRLGNDGAGPARIAGMQISYKGTAQSNVRDLLAACCADDPTVLGYGEARLNGEVLRPGETVAFVTLTPEQSGREVWSRFERERFAMNVEVCFCSVLDECWVRDMSRSGSQRVEECPADWTQFTLAPRDPEATLTPPSE